MEASKTPQVSQDLNFIEAALEHALMYPSTHETMTQSMYQEAHKELLDAINRVKRIRRVNNGSHVGELGR